MLLFFAQAHADTNRDAWQDYIHKHPKQLSHSHHTTGTGAGHHPQPAAPLEAPAAGSSAAATTSHRDAVRAYRGPLSQE